MIAEAKPKRGDIHPVTGLVYWDTWRGKQRWRTPEVIARWRANMMRHVVSWQKADPVRHRAAQAKFRLAHGKRRNRETRAYRNQWKKDRFKSDPIYALAVTQSSRLRIALKRMGLKKTSKISEVVGCTFDFLKSHIESQFKPGMTWQNYGYRGWHVDHRIPLASATTIQQVQQLCHYTNLQPLWMAENFAKGSKIIAA